MVSLSEVQSSNSLISSTFSPGLVAVFVGGTSGIGEITLKKFAQHTKQPRAYLIGRSQDAANRIVEECKKLNPGGEYTFIKGDVSLLRVVDDLCKEIKAKEKVLNLLFLSAGVPSMDRSGMRSSLISDYSSLKYLSGI
jgi:NADP-dependent 3-hydroxy acid dehydrogenase YdfG